MKPVKKSFVLEYTKKIFTSVSLAQGVGYLPRREPPL